VPENRDDPHSRTITLKLAVLRSSAQVASKDMLVFLAGGPGQAATDSAGAIAFDAGALARASRCAAARPARHRWFQCA
jgi:hypothetical protein